jgi:formate--tetrahydrofolate ligase
MKPNLVQTVEGTPAIIHGGPFANIAHGCNSVVATNTALSLADYVVTEAGFGADLGAEKFFDIKCRAAGLSPACAVIVATARALKYNGGASRNSLHTENIDALQKGLPNLVKHIENVANIFGMNVVVAINKFVSDTAREVEIIRAECARAGAEAVVTEAWEFGGSGAVELADSVIRACERRTELKFAYPLSDTPEQKIRAVASRVYGADDVEFSARARAALAAIAENGFDELPVCIAKTQYSLSDDSNLLGRPTGFTIKINDVILRSGAGFIVATAGDIMLMPGLSKNPAACAMTLDRDGAIGGLF